MIRKRGKLFRAEGQAVAKFQNLKRAVVEKRGSAGTISKSTKVGWDVRMRNRDYHSVTLAQAACRGRRGLWERRLSKWTEARSGRDLSSVLESVSLILKALGSQ